MKHIATTGIVLSRTDYGEADRILTVLSHDQGKLRLMAKGVRRVRSKLAGGIELFSVSEITFIRGRGDISTLVSARLRRHYGQIVQDLERVQLGYECIQLLNKNTEESPERDYFILLDQVFIALNDFGVDMTSLRLWFQAQLLRLSGLLPNLLTDVHGDGLRADNVYSFSFEDMAFVPNAQGRFMADHIKLVRILFGDYNPEILKKVRIEQSILESCAVLVQAMFSTSLRI